MHKKRFVGFVLAAAGILLALSKIALTGAVIGEAKSSFLGVSAAILVIAGLVIIAASREKELLHFRSSRDYSEMESELKNIIGTKKYGSLSEDEKMLYLKSYRRHLEKQEPGWRPEYRKQRAKEAEEEEARRLEREKLADEVRELVKKGNVESVVKETERDRINDSIANVGAEKAHGFDHVLNQYDNNQLSRINAAISRVGTGLAHEEYLRHLHVWAIRIPGMGRFRLIYKKNDEGTPVLTDVSDRHYEDLPD